jgi:predicted nucleic acid-binding Zn ribbon protein
VDDTLDSCAGCGATMADLCERVEVLHFVPSPDGTLAYKCTSCYDPAEVLEGMARYLAVRERRAAYERRREAAAEYIERPAGLDIGDLRYGYGDSPH